MSTKTKVQQPQALPIDIQMQTESTPSAGEPRKTARSFFREPGGTYYYSAGIVSNKNVFVTPEYMDLMVNAFKLMELKMDIKNLAYVIMPNHFSWIFRLSDTQDDPVKIYGELKKQVTLEIIRMLCQEAKDGAVPFELLDIFKDNQRVGRSSPRTILWTFKQQAKELPGERRYCVWDKKSKLFNVSGEANLLKNLKFVAHAPVRERWQLVSDAAEYPYLFIDEEYSEQVTA